MYFLSPDLAESFSQTQNPSAEDKKAPEVCFQIKCPTKFEMIIIAQTSMLDFASSRSLLTDSQTPWKRRKNIFDNHVRLFWWWWHWQRRLKTTLTASMMFLVATTETPLSATPCENRKLSLWYLCRSLWKVILIILTLYSSEDKVVCTLYLLYVAEHHLFAGSFNLLDQADQ